MSDLRENISVHSFGSEVIYATLDIGCDYGTQLAITADRGWKCFGVDARILTAPNILRRQERSRRKSYVYTNQLSVNKKRMPWIMHKAVAFQPKSGRG
jgi:hypothetical protein